MEIEVTTPTLKLEVNMSVAEAHELRQALMFIVHYDNDHDVLTDEEAAAVKLVGDALHRATVLA